MILFGIFLSFLFLLPGGLHARVYFHSDFECGETYLETEIKPGKKQIRLMASPALEEWPLDGGEGVMEGNDPRAADIFRYEKRTGTLLTGVSGIRRKHPKWAQVQTGNFLEWYPREIYSGIYGNNRISLSGENPLLGLYSARFKTDSGPPAQMILSRRASMKSLHVRFYVLLGPHLLDTLHSGMVLLDIGRDGSSFHSVYVRNWANPFVFSSPGAKKVLEQDWTGCLQIESGKKYCVEFTFSMEDSNRTAALLTVNGEPQGSCIAEFPIPGNSPEWSFQFGQSYSAQIRKAEFFIDGVVISDSAIGPIPEKPRLTLQGHTARSSPFSDAGALSRHAASQWQIHNGNFWFAPVYNSGWTKKALLSLDIPYQIRLSDTLHEDAVLAEPQLIPTGIKGGGRYLVRMRMQNTGGAWSDWSAPLPFVAPFANQPGGIRPFPEIKKAFFAEINGRKPLQKIQRGKWVDLYVYFSDPSGKGLEALAYGDVYLSADPPNSVAGYENRGGRFDSGSNYVLCFDFHSYCIYTKETQGMGQWTRIMPGTKALYCDDSLKQYVQNNKEGWVKARVRLLPDARTGPWVISGHGKNTMNALSPLYRRIFYVAGDPEASGEEKYPWLFMVALGAIFLLAVILVTGLRLRIRRKEFSRKPKGPAEALLDEMENEKDLPGPETFHNEKIKKAIEFILANSHKPITANDVAEAIFVSLTSLSASFPRETGKNISVYINEVRIRNAKKLLRETNASIEEISFGTGFSGPKYFSHVFHSIAGMSPRQYRKSKKK